MCVHILLSVVLESWPWTFSHRVEKKDAHQLSWGL
jgi:hypothetical protein